MHRKAWLVAIGLLLWLIALTPRANAADAHTIYLKFFSTTRGGKQAGCELSYGATYFDELYRDAGAGFRSSVIGSINLVKSEKGPFILFKAIGLDFHTLEKGDFFDFNYVMLRAGDKILTEKFKDFDCDGGKCMGFPFIENNLEVLEKLSRGSFEIVYNRVEGGMDMSVPIVASDPEQADGFQKFRSCMFSDR
jgi:hypothetical protein